MTTDITKTDNTVVITAPARLDTITSAEFEEALTPYTVQGVELIIDCREMKYISSAGLRIILTAHKRVTANSGRFIIRNTSKEVRSVLEMTGFSRILTIE